VRSTASSGVLVPSVQLAVLAGAALLFLAGLLAERRSIETAIFRSRGAGRRDVGLLALAEGALLAAPAVLVAPWLAVISLRALNHVGPLADVGLELEPRVGATSYALAAVAGILCAAGLSLPALRPGAVTTTVQEQGRPRPSGIVRRAGLDLVLVVLAVIAYWQLRRYEGPVVESIRGRLGIDPVLVAAPALGLLAGALLSLRVLPAVAGLIERAAASTRGPVAPLGTRELARRPARYASAAVLLTLAVAIGLFASSYSSTWLRSQEDRAAYDAGADIRVRPDERTGSIPAVQLAGAYAGLDGVDAALPVVETPVEVSGGGEPATLLAVDAAGAAEIVDVRPDLVGNRPLAEATAPLDGGPELATIELPGEPGSLEISASAALEPLEDGSSVFGFERRATAPTVAVVLQDGAGLLHRLQAGVLQTDGEPHRLVVPLEGTGGAGRPAYPLSLVAIELGTAAAFGDSRRGTFTVEGISGDGAPAPAEEARWVVEPSALQGAISSPEVIAVRSGSDPLLAYDFATGASGGFGEAPAVTFSARPGPAEAPETIPALVTDSFLDRTGTEVGGTVALGPEQPRLRIAASVQELPTLPPEQGGALVDLRTFLATMYLRTGEVAQPSEWLVDTAAGRERAVAEELRSAPFSSNEVVDRAGVEDRLTRDPVALGISGALSLGFVAAAVFAVVGFAVSAAVSTAERTTEFAVLRSLGLSERQLSGWLALEGALTAAFALVGGLLLGAVVAWLVLPFVSLAGEGGRPFPDVIVELPWETMLVLSGGLVAAVLVVLAVQLVLLRRLSVGSALRAGGGT
jgi:FtsX-like permease family